MKNLISLLFFIIAIASAGHVSPTLQSKLDQQASQLESKVIEWRRHLHQYPELSNRGTKAAAYTAAHLKSPGLDVQTEVAKTGVVGMLDVTVDYMNFKKIECL